MQDILDFFATNNGVALIIALVIFIITLILVVKRLIGFVITIILLAFALISGFFVANADLFRDVLKGLTQSGTPEEKDTVSQLKAQFFKAYEDLKAELKEQKAEFEKIIEKSKPKEEPAAPKEEKKAEH
jgi:predicted membrane protein